MQHDGKAGFGFLRARYLDAKALKLKSGQLAATGAGPSGSRIFGCGRVRAITSLVECHAVTLSIFEEMRPRSRGL